MPIGVMIIIWGTFLMMCAYITIRGLISALKYGAKTTIIKKSEPKKFPRKKSEWQKPKGLKNFAPKILRF